MKKIKLLTLSLIFGFIAAFGGCSLAVPEGEEGGDNGNNIPPNVKTEFEDSYAGVMVEVLDGEDNRLTSRNMGDENCVAFALRYESNVYEINGKHHGCIYQDVSGDDYFAECAMFTSVNNDDEETKAELTVYCNASRSEDLTYGIRTLSYDENGEIALGGGAYHSNLSHGGSGGTDFNITQKITESKTWNGVTESNEKSMTLRVKLTIEGIKVGTDWKILQYHEDGSLINTNAVSVEDDEDIQLEADCAYVIYEETLNDGTKRRELKQIDDEKNYIHFYYDGGFGLLKSKPFKLVKGETE